MTTKQPNSIPIILLLIITAFISMSLFLKQNLQHDTVDITQFPKTIGPWTSVDLEISADEFAILETTNAFARKYTNSLDNAEVYLYIVYSQFNRKVAHPPEICYTGSGLTILENKVDPIKVSTKEMTIEANRLKLTKPGFTHIAFYWFKVGDRFIGNYWQQQMLIVLNTLLGRQVSSALVRVSADVVNGDEAKAIENVKSLTNELVPPIFHYLP